MAENTPYKFASTQVNLTGPVADEMLAFARGIPDDEIDATDGRETEPHVTIKYGLHTSDPNEIFKATEGVPPLVLTLGKTSIFPANEKRNSDVVKIDVTSPDLHRLNAKLARALPHTDTYPDYRPHAMIAYVKPGIGKKYDANTSLEGKSITVDRIVFSSQDGTKTEIPLTLPIAASAVPVAYHLHYTGDPFADALTLGQGWPSEVGGVKCFYRTKDIIRAGRFVHPQKGFEVKVDSKRMDKWVSTFDEMTRNGVKVPLPMDHSPKAKDNLGKTMTMERKGDRLFSVVQFIGEDALNIGARNEVSVGIDPNFKDGEGRAYGDAIVHVAITPYPVVTGQNSFQAASRSAAAGDVLTFAADTAQTSQKGERKTHMSDRMFKCSDEQLTSLHQLVPGLADAPDDEKLSKVAQHLSAIAATDDEDAGGPEKIAKLSRADIATAASGNRKAWRTENARLIADATTLRQQVQTLSAKVVKDLDPEAHAAIRESAETKMETAVARGAISPATRDALRPILLGTVEAPNTLTLSRAANPKGSKALALALLDVLVDNRPVELGEKSGLQSLAREVPDAKPKPTSAEQAQAMLLESANRFAPAGK